MKENKYTLKEIKEAVNMAVGDDGLRGEEVVSILIDEYNTGDDNVKVHDLSSDMSTIIKKVESIEQSLLNIDAKYKKKINEIMFLIEPPPSFQELMIKSKNNKENTNEKIN